MNDKMTASCVEVPLPGVVDIWDVDYLLEELTTGLKETSDLLFELALSESVDDMTGNALHGVRQLVRYYSAMSDTAHKLSHQQRQGEGAAA